MNTTPPSMPEDGTHISGSNPRRMARGKVGHPESPGSRRGLFVDGVTRFFCGRRYAVFLWTALCGFFVDGVMRFFVGGVMRFFVDGVTRFFVGGVMPGLGLLVSPRSPGWQPGDTGHENHPAIHAG